MACAPGDTVQWSAVGGAKIWNYENWPILTNFGICIAERVGSKVQQVMIITLRGRLPPSSSLPSVSVLSFPSRGLPFSKARGLGAFYISN